MAAYRRAYGFGHLRADCRGPGSAWEYGLPFTFCEMQQSWQVVLKSAATIVEVQTTSHPAKYWSTAQHVSASEEQSQQLTSLGTYPDTVLSYKSTLCVCICVKASNGLPSIHLSTSNPNLLSMDLTDSAGLGSAVSPSVSAVDSGMAVDKLHEQFYSQARAG